MSEDLKSYRLRIPSISTAWFYANATSEDDAVSIMVEAINQHGRTGSADYGPRDVWEVQELSFYSNGGWRREGGKVILK